MKSKLNRNRAFQKGIALILASVLLISASFSLISCVMEKGESETSGNTETNDNISDKDENALPSFSEGLYIVDSSKPIYSYKEMESDIKELCAKYGDKISYESIGKSLDGRNIYALTLGKKDAKKEILITSGIHAREYLTPLLIMKQVEYYLYNTGRASVNGVSFSSVFDEYTFRILPMCNPDGTELVQFGIGAINSSELKKGIMDIYHSDVKLGYTGETFEDYLLYWKANANGVDLNRNFDTARWENVNYNSAPSYKNYKGESPLSEPETKALVDYTNSLGNVVLSLAIHSQGEVIYFDCGQDNIHPSLRLAKAVSEVNGYFVLYETRAEAAFDDWCIIEKGIPSVTVEIAKYEVGTRPDLNQFTVAFEKNKDLWFYMAIYDKTKGNQS